MSQFSEQDLPPGRHRLLKEHLMNEIRRTGEMNESRRTGEASDRTRRRWTRPVLAAAAVAAVTAVTFTVLPSSGGPGGAKMTAASVLEQVASGAEGGARSIAIRDDQYVYVDTRVASVDTAGDGTVKRTPLHRVETWVAVDGLRDGLLRTAGLEDRRLSPEACNLKYSSSYKHLKTLPADADRMYDWLRTNAGLWPLYDPQSECDISVVPSAAPGDTAESSTAPGREDEHTYDAMFQVAGHLIQDTLVPPEQRAALYRAVARIPGVALAEDGVDAVGRHGVAITREDPFNPFRYEWIFDRGTHEFLGERKVATRSEQGLKKGEVVRDTAVLRRAVVDKSGQRP
ncbi:CU044_5270 family protein [Streptomyces sp. NPDC001443]